MSTATCCRTGLPDHGSRTVPIGTAKMQVNDSVEAMGLEPTNLLTASQALYQLSYAPVAKLPRSRVVFRLPQPGPIRRSDHAPTSGDMGHPSGPEEHLSF
jgi:hypothetical protein